MRPLAHLCAFILLTLATSRAGEDAFASLPQLMQKKLPAQCEISPITKDERSGWRSFDLKAPGSSYTIVVFERPYLTQQD